MERRKRLLVIRNSALGDVAMTLPVIYSLAEKYPQLDVYVLTRPLFARIFIHRPPNVTMIEADFKGAHKGLRGLMRLLKQLGSYRFDYVADFHNVLRSWIIDAYLHLRGSRVAMVDKQRSKRKGLFEGKYTGQRDYILRYAGVLLKLGYPVKLTFRSVFEHNAPELPFELQHPVVGLAPFARYTNKTYPAAQMRVVAEKLAAKGVQVLTFGGRGAEAEELALWEAEIPGCISVAGKYGIEEEMALMSRLDVMVSMDSANQHLASATGTPVITIWGSTTPACGFSPYRQPEGRAVMLGLECQPCTVAGSENCRRGDFACMRQLSPDTIVDAVEKFLNNG